MVAIYIWLTCYFWRLSCSFWRWYLPDYHCNRTIIFICVGSRQHYGLNKYLCGRDQLVISRTADFLRKKWVFSGLDQGFSDQRHFSYIMNNLIKIIWYFYIRYFERKKIFSVPVDLKLEETWCYCLLMVDVCWKIFGWNENRGKTLMSWREGETTHKYSGVFFCISDL